MVIPFGEFRPPTGRHSHGTICGVPGGSAPPQGRAMTSVTLTAPSDGADEPAVVLPPVLRAVRPPDQGCPAGLAPCPGQDLRLPPALVGAQHLGLAMPRFVPGAAHHHASRDASGHGLNWIVAGHHPGTLTCSIMMRKSRAGLACPMIRRSPLVSPWCPLAR